MRNQKVLWFSDGDVQSRTAEAVIYYLAITDVTRTR